ncbi:MAG TPA: aldehyde dehydrogenase [Frankiaceae bacterium]|jgi:acyl-CoA reductase-like NAD-dependent aldehyde dehydrogenase|nr:aldehyde dehydrogenase [Frankiaceae bacterium]
MSATESCDFDRLLVGSCWTDPATRDRLEISAPANGDQVGSAPHARPADVDKAVAAARRAFDKGPWPRLSIAERIAALTPVRERLETLVADLDVLATRENGVPISVQATMSAVAVFDWYLKEAACREESEQRTGAFGTRGTIYREPVGVVAGIVPWNGPLLQAVGKLAPALLSGCTAVLKPAPETPLSSLLLAGLFADAGLPDGVVSILPGDRDTGGHLVSHPRVDAVAFTGSTAAGRLIAAETGRALKRATLELGGKSAAVVLDDADPAATATLVALGCMAYSGQACAALTRALIPVSRYDEFASAIDAAVGAMPVGDPLDPATVIGPLVAERQLTRVLEYIESGIAQGAKALRGGGRLADRPEGWFVEPTILTGVDNAMRVAQEEIFGPVLCLIPYESETEAIHLANDTPYGLSGAIFSSDDDRATRVARALRTGSVGINALAGDVGLPFGGFKCSGIGREFSSETFDHFTELKTVARMDTAGFGLMSASA